MSGAIFLDYIAAGLSCLCVELPNTTSFLVIPEEKAVDKFTSSKITKETLCRILRPADCGLRIKKVTYAGGSGVRVEAVSPDIEKIKAYPGLAEAGLKIQENT
ncbi:hypothetical protein RF55_12214 [Lasius niger]|uniref:Uncharacterized protein n=1 Tax=Lasius niger TaxID=67767 RepID=A0A0J7KCY3_LASNI|nr:hypothetical protein RF55_12214 [Lasius niger]